ncbi:MAG TPA: cytochrome P450 [Acidimicrobiales bacterium]|nr:cytochrome P450 [Acidimicrobiales bacterium]
MSVSPGALRTDEFHRDPYPTYKVLRDEHPVFHDVARGAYVLTRFADVREAARDHVRFSSAATRSEVFDRITRMDPPEHDLWRDLLSARFRSRRIGTLEADVRSVARALLAVGNDGRGFDVVEQFAAPIPSTMIGDLIGLPREQHLRCHVLSEISIAGEPAEAAAANDEIYAMFEPVLAARRREPADDLVSALLSAAVDGRALSHEQLLGYCLHLVVAGNDTTANLIGTGALFLARNPNLRARLVANPSLIADFVEEMLRHDGPVQMLLRTTVVPVELHDVIIPAGAPVELYWGAANRDERQFRDPDVFVLGRPEMQHLGFGHGVHFCLGAHLARLEARVAFEELLAVAPDYRLTSDQSLTIKPGWSIRGYHSVCVAL